MTRTLPTPKVLWLQVWALAIVQGAIALTWVIYNLYLVQLLTQFGFPASLATGLLIIENLMAAVMEPLMGSFSDRSQRWVGSRFPLIAMGTILSSACFILIPAVFVLGNGAAAWRWLLPAMMVAWALAMTVFRSPSLSLLGRYAFATNLPQAASILTVVGGVAGALGPLAGNLILSWGAIATFAIGSGVLLVSAAALRSVHPDQTVQPSDLTDNSVPSQSLSFISLGWAFGAGAGVALGFRLLMQNFPRILDLQGLSTSKGIVLGMIFVALALTAIPAGKLAVRMGNRVAMMMGLVAMAGLCSLLLLSRSWETAIAIAIGLGAAFSLVANGTIPFALSLVPPEKAGLGTGIYFSGGAIATSVFATFLSAKEISPVLGSLIGAIAFLGAGLCVMLSARPTQVRSARL